MHYVSRETYLFQVYTLGMTVYSVRGGDMLRNIGETRTMSERALLWFLRAYELEHGQGATKEQVLLFSCISERNFARAWPRLLAAGLVKSVCGQAV